MIFNSIHIYSFIHVSGCVGMGPTVLLCAGAYNAIKTVLLIGQQNCMLYLSLYCDLHFMINKFMCEYMQNYNTQSTRLD